MAKQLAEEAKQARLIAEERRKAEEALLAEERQKAQEQERARQQAQALCLAKRRGGKETGARKQVASTRDATPLEREGKN